jgi:acyl carrier protein
VDETRVTAVVDRAVDSELGSSTFLLAADTSLMGVASVTIVKIVFAIEDELDIEFPEELLVADTFSDVGTLRRAVLDLVERDQGREG